MLIDGHLLVGTTLMSFARPRSAGSSTSTQAIALFPAPPTAKPDRARRQRPACRVPDDLRLHPVDAGQGRSAPPSARMPRWRSRRRSTTRSPPPTPGTTRACCACGGASRTRRTRPRDRASSISPTSTSSASGRRPAPCCAGLRASASAGSTRAWPTSGTGSASTASSGRRRSSGRSCCSCRPAPAPSAGRPAEGLSAVDRAIDDPRAKAPARPSCPSYGSRRATCSGPGGR